MARRLIPVTLGLGAGVMQFALPEPLGTVLIVLAAFGAGWFLPEAPMKAAILYLLPPSILTHFAAGIAVRRRDAEQLR